MRTIRAIKCPPKLEKEIQLEIAHVLFIDIVGYSKLSINEQRGAIDELTQAVRTSEQFQNAEAAARLIKIPTGDGMALVFYKGPEEPVECALEISRALKEHPKLQLRMGVHSGPVSGVIDVNGHANLAGAGLNMAQRVMDCGDAGHILLSKRVADDLGDAADHVQHRAGGEGLSSRRVAVKLSRISETIPHDLAGLLRHRRAPYRGGARGARSDAAFCAGGSPA